MKGPQPPIQEAEKKEFQDRLFAMECNLLRVVDFKLDFENGLPMIDYTKRYAKYLYEHHIGQAFTQVQKCADAIANDSFFTYVNVLYPIQTVALACVLMAAARYKHATPLQATSNSS